MLKYLFYLWAYKNAAKVLKATPYDDEIGDDERRPGVMSRLRNKMLHRGNHAHGGKHQDELSERVAALLHPWRSEEEERQAECEAAEVARMKAIILEAKRFGGTTPRIRTAAVWTVADALAPAPSFPQLAASKAAQSDAPRAAAAADGKVGANAGVIAGQGGGAVGAGGAAGGRRGSCLGAALQVRGAARFGALKRGGGRRHCEPFMEARVPTEVKRRRSIATGQVRAMPLQQ